MNTFATSGTDPTLRNLFNAVNNAHARRVDFDGALLRHIRISAGVSIAMVAAVIGVSTFTVSLWEKAVRVPQDRFLPRLERLLGVLSETL